MFKKILLGVGVALLVFVAIVAMQSDQFKIERSIVVNTVPAVPFAAVNDFHQWTVWSPWSKRDPQMKTSFSGSPSGVGAIYAWQGNDQVGEGSQQIVESKENASIKINLTFLKPFKGENVVDFSFVPEGQGTKVTWAMTGKSNFVSKAMVMTGAMEKMVGKDFSEGLANLKVLVETPAPPAAAKKK